MRLSFWLIALTTLALACGKSKTVEPDADIMFDASRPDVPVVPDAGTDSALPGSDIGAACRGDSDCDGICIDDWPGGYCSSPCGGGLECPDGATCTPVGRGQEICLMDCDAALADPCDRTGYGCASDFRFPMVCIPGCTDDADCTDGLTCDPTGGGVGSGSCFDPGASVGDSCVDDEECTAGGFCLAEFFSGWPEGSCIAFGCDIDSDTGCDDDAHCLPSGRGGGLCFDGCATTDDCRDGYSCEPDEDFPSRLICTPACTSDAACSGGRVCNPAIGICDDPFDADQLGVPCSTVRGACAGGSCLSEFESGFPGSYCAFAGCDPTMDDAGDGCPGTGVCLADEDGGTNFCIDGCVDDRDCRSPDYSCRQVDRDDATKGLGCFPSCVNDSSCANDGAGGSPDFSCNPGTGLCTDPFETARLGEPCEDGDDCPGGACLSESADGWPAGTCAAVGCRLTGSGPEQVCPAGGVCVDDDQGDPEIGACLVACTTDGSECRSGYQCIVIAGTDGACRPSCTAGGCTGTRTCNLTSGLCE